jgi:hypothetical protein
MLANLFIWVISFNELRQSLETLTWFMDRVTSCRRMNVSVSVEALMVILFFLLSTALICLCTCNSDSIWQICLYFKSLISAQYGEKTAASSTVYTPHSSYKRNWASSPFESNIPFRLLISKKNQLRVQDTLSPFGFKHLLTSHTNCAQVSILSKACIISSRLTQFHLMIQ